jgi:uncharacterized OB-fold protein
MEGSTAGSPLEVVHLAGTFPASVGSWIPELLGHAVTVVQHGSDPNALFQALRATAGDHLGTRAVVAVDAPPIGAPERWGAVGVAFRVGDGRGIEVLPSLESRRGDPGRVPVLPARPAVRGIGAPPLCALAFALHARFGPPGAEGGRIAAEAGGWDAPGFRETGPIEWVGDWTGTSSAPRSIEAGTREATVEGHLFAVSEGAYVPKPRYLENLPSRWRFVAERCRNCGTITFPVRGSCRSCQRPDTLDRISLPLHGGTVLASTVIARGGQPTEFDGQVDASGPYGVVLVELAPRARVTLQVADAAPGAVRIGDRVDTRLRRLYPMEGEWRYGRKAIPTVVPGD